MENNINAKLSSIVSSEWQAHLSPQHKQQNKTKGQNNWKIERAAKVRVKMAVWAGV